MDEIQANKYFFFSAKEDLSRRGAAVHYHSFFEIYLLTNGGGDSFVDDKLYKMQPGDIVIIPPGTIHGTNYTTERHGRVLMNFSSHYVPSGLIEELTKDSYFYRCEATREEIAHIFEMIKKEYSEPDSFSEEAIRSLIATLIIAVMRYAPREASVQTINSFIEKAVNYVHNNYQNPMPLDEIASECDVSKVHLSREFKKKIGIGLSEYISIYRMKKAKELLLTRDKMSICEIAFSCGFNDSNYFSWLFKKTYGVTPSQYRKNTRE